MNPLICERLGLAVENWPPDHYALLGLPRGEGDSQVIEDRVHERMQRVRPLQIAYPEEASEAMNRLAQAWSCLTDPVARSAYNQSLLGTPGRLSPNNNAPPDPEDALSWLFEPWDRLAENESPVPASPAPPFRDWKPSIRPPRRRQIVGSLNGSGQEKTEKSLPTIAEESPKPMTWFWRNSHRLFLFASLLALGIALWRQISR
ncbi:MAG TPA: hypothetical protein VGX70_17695 [Gemmataceae bacterium]|jgi:hypothetical protein|nr:hypothetical protein [Gemmataceae bacterium]